MADRSPALAEAPEDVIQKAACGWLRWFTRPATASIGWAFHVSEVARA